MTASATDFETKQTPWWLVLMGGILSVVIGVLLLTLPAKTVFALTLALGIYWIIQGIFTLVGMFIDHSAWGWKLFIGILSILAGIVILRYPISSAVVIPATYCLDPGHSRPDLRHRDAHHGLQGRWLGRRDTGCAKYHLWHHLDGELGQPGCSRHPGLGGRVLCPVCRYCANLPGLPSARRLKLIRNS